MASNSLRSLLLRQLLPAIVILLVAGAAMAYWVALRNATRAYDRALFDSTLAIVQQLQGSGGKPPLPLAPQAKAVLLTDKFDQMFYAIHGQDNQLLDGNAGLPMPSRSGQAILHDQGRLYYDGMLQGKPIRLAALRTELDGKVYTILAGETLVKREVLVREIILGMLLPELLLAATTLTVVWFGVRSGLRPLTGLQGELAGRSHADLSPITSDVPEELQPVVGEINDLLVRLERSLSSQRHFVSDAAHQLRTPIAALLAQVEAVLQEANPQTRPRLEGILSAAHRLAHLVDQLLALARAEPTSDLTQPEVALEAVAQAVAETWLPAAFSKGIDLGFALSPAPVRGNRLLLQELLSNLVDNALRHTPAGGTVTVGCGADSGKVWLCVEDSGQGIAEHERGKVFERFYQSPDSRSDGNGLGLAIVLAIAKQHHGQAIIDQSPDLGGARVTVSLPLAIETRPAEATPSLGTETGRILA